MGKPIMKKTRKDTTSREGGLYMSSNRNNKKGNRGFKKLITGAIAAALAIVLCVTMIPQDALAATDTNTAGEEYYKASLGDEYSTEYAGRIWSDKSVDTETQTYNDKSVSLSEGEEFLVTFSTLSTSQSITGSATAPVDVVFVIDMSQSMGTSMGSGSGNRLYNAVNALNTSVTDILALNPNNRVGVIAFNSTSYELLPLDSYTVNGNNAFFSCRSNGSTVTINAVNSAGTVISKTHSSSNGTNIQKGLSAGLNMLATEDSTTVTIDGKTVTRIPAVVLLSDGQPTSASDYTTWWNINADTAKKGPVSTSAIYGMKALMTGAYMKEAVNVNYNLTNASTKTQVYTIGVGISSLGTNEKNLANVTLNPEDYLSANNTMSNSIEDAWNTYRGGNTAALSGYSFNHPSGSLVNNVVDIGRVTASDTTIAYEDLFYADEYYDATSASDVADVFAQIVQNISISTPEVSTEIKGDNPITDGYITYTDPIGEYMEVKNIKALVYNDQTFVWDETRDTKTTSGSVTTYTFRATETVDTGVYEDQSVGNIIIEVTQVDKTNQTMVIKVPAALVPVRVNTVILDANGAVTSHTHNDMDPLRVIYSVGLQSGLETNGVINTDLLSEDYILANKNDDGTINFYSNLYTGNAIEHIHIDGSSATATVGDTTVTFEPSHSNPFYYIQDEQVVYNSEGEKVKASDLNANGELPAGTYHYIETYYHGTSKEEKIVERTAEQLNRTDLIVGSDGYVYREADTPRLNKIMAFSGKKADDGASTGTAKTFYLPTFEYGGVNKDDAHAGYYKIYLGNNGVIAKAASGNLEISKTVELNGFTGPGDIAFEFKVDFTGASGAYEYDIYAADGTKVTTGTNTIADGGTISLKDGEKAVITGIPDGVGYEVTETKIAGFEATVTGTEGAQGTIAAGETDVAAFLNSYDVEPLAVDIDATINASKVLKGRDWIASDTFTFYLKSRNFDDPMPEEVEGVSVLTEVEDSYQQLAVTVKDKEGTKEGTPVAVEFGNITYTKPGVYVYEISEDTALTIDGISYSAAMYEVVVTVTDNGNGKLSASVVLNHDLDDHGATPSPANTSAIFTNEFKPDEQGWTPYGTKVYTDTTGVKSLTNYMFQFTMKGLDGAPMPEGTTGEITVSNLNHDIAYKEIMYSGEGSYKYKFAEVTGDIAGMTYDTNVYFAKVDVTLEGTILKVTANYYKDLECTQPLTTGLQFANTYDPTDAKATITGTKTLAGRTWQSSDEFTFTLSAANDAAASLLSSKLTDTVKGTDTEKDFSFDELTFSKPGTYVFNISEEVGTIGGITYDSHVSVVTVTVTDNGQGALAAETTYSDGINGAEFTNVYSAEPAQIDVNLKATKTLTGRPINAGEFFIVVNPLGDAPMGRYVDVAVPPVSTENVSGEYATGEFDLLRNLTFTESGTYVYEIYEQIPTGAVNSKLDGVTYDTNKYTLTVVVTDNGSGSLVANATLKDAQDKPITDEDDDGDFVIDFTNHYTVTSVTHAAPAVDKELAGYRNTSLAEDEFEFAMVVTNDADGNKIHEQTVTNDASGKVSFSAIAFEKAGTYTAAITEIIPAGAVLDQETGLYSLNGVTYSDNILVVKYTVVDNGNGNLIVSTSHVSGEHVFTNEYHSTGIAVVDIHKTVKDDKGNVVTTWGTDDSFAFEVVVADTATDAAIKNGDIVFQTEDDHILNLTINSENNPWAQGQVTVNKAGTYKFNVHEVVGTIPAMNYDGSTHAVVITAVDDGKGNITATTTYEGTTINKNGTNKALEFVNVYDPTSTVLSGHNNLRVYKVFTGREDNVWYDSDQFTFSLEAVKDYGTAVELATTTLTINNTNKLYAHFGDITFHTAGEYQFKITEVTGNILGVSYDSSAYYVTVSVVDKNGALQASVTSIQKGEESVADMKVTFTNTYSVEETVLEGAANLAVTKVLEGRDWFNTDEFKFTLAAKDTSTQNAIDEGIIILPENAAGITVNATAQTNAFGDIVFKEAGTYTFVIREVDNDITGITYDKHDAIITVTVTDDREGNLIAAATTSETSKTFTNVYTPEPAMATFVGEKVLDGRSLLSTDEFTFTISAKTANAPMPAVTTVTNSGDVISFGAVQFTEVGTYEYTITEKDGHIPGIAYDTVPVDVKVVVTNNAATGKLEAAVAYAKAGIIQTEGFTFVNTYTYSPSDPVTFVAHKHVIPTANHTFHMEAGDFSFGIEASEHNPASDPVKHAIVTNDETGAIFFKDAVYTEAGTYVYTIHEVDGIREGIIYDESVYTVTVMVTDNPATGKLATSVKIVKTDKDGSAEVNAITFNNTYDPGVATAIIHGHKHVLGGHKHVTDFAGDLTFRLIATNDAAKAVTATPLEATATETGLIKFNELTFTHVGTYTYEMTEVSGSIPGMTYDDVVHKICITVTDVGGALKADVTMDTSHYGDEDEMGVFNNTYLPKATSIDLSGAKNLEGRPIVDGEFEFELIDELGNVVAATENAGNSFTFDNLPFDKAGIYKFTIVEKDTNIAGVTYDLNTVYVAEVTVVDNNGKLEVTDVAYMKDNATADVVFTNSYAAENPATIKLGAAKTLSGRELKAGEFTFLLTGSDGTALTAVNGADGSVLFDELTFTEAGTYTYVITEAKGNAENVTYDGSKYTVTVVVKDDLKGNLIAEITSITESVAGKEIAANAVAFENAYTAPDPGTSPKTNDIFNIWMLLAVIAVAGFGFFGATAYSRRS